MERLSLLRCCASNQKLYGPNPTDLSATLRIPNSVLGFSWLLDQNLNIDVFSLLTTNVPII